MTSRKQFLFIALPVVLMFNAPLAQAYLGKMEIFDRDGKMAKEACDTKDLHAGYDPDESAKAQTRDKEIAADNAKTAAIGKVQAGQGQNEQGKNTKLSEQSLGKAQACRNAYERCMQAAEIENKVYGAEGKKAGALGLGGWQKNREEIADKAKKGGEKCKEFASAADKAEQQAKSNQAGADLNGLVQAANSLGAAAGGGSGGGGGAAPAPSGAGSAPASAGPVAGVLSGAGTSPKLAGDFQPGGVNGNPSLTSPSGVVGGFKSDFDAIPAEKAVSASTETKGGRTVLAGNAAAGAGIGSAANKFSLQGGRSEMAGSGSGAAGGGGVGGEVRTGGGRTVSGAELAQAGSAAARARTQRAVGGMSLKAVDGITGPTGPSLFEKVSSSFQRLMPSMYAAPEDLPAPTPNPDGSMPAPQ